MQIRCYRCGMSYALSQEEIGFAVAALRAEDAIHYDSPCPRCRTKNRVSLEQLEDEAKNRGIPIPELPPEQDAGTEE
jgi:hypothetical protein